MHLLPDLVSDFDTNYLGRLESFNQVRSKTEWAVLSQTPSKVTWSPDWMLPKVMVLPFLSTSLADASTVTVKVPRFKVFTVSPVDVTEATVPEKVSCLS